VENPATILKEMLTMAFRLPPRPLRRLAPLALVAGLVGGTAPGTAPAGAVTYTKKAVVTGLANPVTFAFAPDGRIFYGERLTGELHIYDPASGRDSLFASYDVGTGQEQGLLGVVLHPNYPAKPFVYVYLTHDLSGGAGTDLHNQILRVRDAGGTAGKTRVLMNNSVGPAHNGGRLLFGPDGMLYVLIGEKTAPANAQDLSNMFGKISRMRPNGDVPPDNPFVGRAGANPYLYDYGHRNGFGLAFDPLSGQLWESEAGPECNDEINRIVAGRNYGWGPHFTCSTPPAPPLNTNQDGRRPVLPRAYFTPVITPDGMTFCDACGLGAGANGDLFFGSFNDRAIREANLSADRTRIASIAPVFTDNNFVFTVESGPDGLYFSDTVGIWKLVA
jgi:glucose/arabinose dehydrogenase